MFFFLIFFNFLLTFQEVIKEYKINPNKISICIYSIDEGKFIYKHNEEKSLIPASNLKILISFYLLENWEQRFCYDLKRYAKKTYSKKQVLNEINSKSNNKLANLLFLLIGKYKKSNSEKVIKNFLRSKQISISNLRMFDGSGYSKRNRLTTMILTKILINIYFSSYQKEFLRSLAVSGKKGTLKRRLLNYKNRIYAKTGYLKNVYALSGYYFKNKNSYIFSIIINDKISPQNYWQFLNNFFALL